MHQVKPKSTRELRKFGLTIAVPLALLGGLALWRGRAAGPYLLTVAAALALAALLLPRALAPLERVWMKVAEVLSAVMTRVVLFLSFFLVITPFGLLLRLFRKDLLQCNFDPQQKSYWVIVESDGPCSRSDKPY
jgi:hypothetical protein